jgi:hypothetical protein
MRRLAFLLWLSVMVMLFSASLASADGEDLINRQNSGMVRSGDGGAIAPDEKTVDRSHEKAKGQPKKQDELKIIIGSWDESCRASSKKTDYTFTYYSVSCADVTFRIDTFNVDRRRYWLNCGTLHVVRSPGLKVDYSPGVQLNNLMTGGRKVNQFFYGGFLLVKVPDIGLSVVQKSYAGAELNFNQTFADLRICKNLDFSLYNFSNSLVIPDTYIGPKLKFPVGKNAQVHAWYGFSTVPQRPEARMLNLGGSITF